MNGLPYYKAYPRDFFEGTIGMPLELKGAYRLLLDLIYMHGGTLTDEPRFISGLLGCSVRAWNGYRAALLAAGKIRADLGIISNFRADKELESLGSFQEKQRKNASNPRKNNGLIQAMAKPKASHTEPEPEESNSVADATDGDAVDPAKAVWDAGVKILGASGVSDRQARSFVGKLRKDHPGQDSQILAAIMDCGRAGAVDPIPWITARLRPATQPDLAAIFAKLDAESRQQ